MGTLSSRKLARIERATGVKIRLAWNLGGMWMYCRAEDGSTFRWHCKTGIVEQHANNYSYSYAPSRGPAPAFRPGVVVQRVGFGDEAIVTVTRTPVPPTTDTPG